MDKVLRVAYFPDSFHEVNGVAMTSNKLLRFVKERDLPFLCVHAGRKTEVTSDGSITYVSLKRSPFSFSMDEGLKYDPFFHRHYSRVKKELEEFQPDVVHITGLNDVSIIGSHVSRSLDVALVGSWHTNIHEYASKRLNKRFGILPEKARHGLTNRIENWIWSGATLYYRIPYVVLAPNQELLDKLGKGTGRTTRLMVRGVDTNLYSPAKRSVSDEIFRFGFVGRLRAEKNVRWLVDIEQKLLDAGKTNFEFLIIGEGNERGYLEKTMKHAVFPGFLEGEQLAKGFANMDVFVFPSETETFGNVIQEANASGVPCIVTDQGGPKFIVQDGATGYIAASVAEFAVRTIELMDDRGKLAAMKTASREFALTRSWDSVFEDLYTSYGEAMEYLEKEKLRRKPHGKLAEN
ncbi:MAG: glycosyltransferase [Acidobacteriota bacterium]